MLSLLFLFNGSIHIAICKGNFEYLYIYFTILVNRCQPVYGHFLCLFIRLYRLLRHTPAKPIDPHTGRIRQEASLLAEVLQFLTSSNGALSGTPSALS